MTNEEFRAWRDSLGLTKVEAAKQLGVSLSTISLFENGTRYDNGKEVLIPKAVEMACYNLSRACLTNEAIAFMELWQSIDWDEKPPVLLELDTIANNIRAAVDGSPLPEN